MSTTKGKYVTAKLYVPPHARVKIDRRAESGHTAEQKKLCDDSNLLFLKAQESEERNARFYLTNLKTKDESSKDECPANNFKGEMVPARPKTCAVPAKRLVSNALGIKAVFSDVEEQEHLQILNERERRKLKQNGNKTI